ncbi:histidine kinase [Tsukamurella tyrosinosolvens]|nr:CBS domain-containing protein [Tsukamurella tyrosinosolvens]AUN41459.1 histidine kinase [Tsukamurella tyrosinosolvens]
MTRARDIMQPSVACVGSTDSAADAARRMSELQVGALPICGEDGRLKGMITDRDIVTKVVARGHDPAHVRAGELAQGEAVTIGADDDTTELLSTMADHQVRRVPVIDGHTLVGIIAQADIARALPDQRVGDLVAAVSFD